MAEGHDPHFIGFFVKEQVVGKSVEVRAPPAARVEVEAFGMCLHMVASILELRSEIVPERIADRIIVTDGLGGVPPDLGMKTRHQRPRSANTPFRSSSIEMV